MCIKISRVATKKTSGNFWGNSKAQNFRGVGAFRCRIAAKLFFIFFFFVVKIELFLLFLAISGNTQLNPAVFCGFAIAVFFAFVTRCCRYSGNRPDAFRWVLWSVLGFCVRSISVGWCAGVAVCVACCGAPQSCGFLRVRGGVAVISWPRGVAGRKRARGENYTPMLSVPREIFGVDETAHILRNLCVVTAHILGVLCVVTAHILAKSMGRLFQRLFSVDFLKHIS